MNRNRTEEQCSWLCDQLRDHGRVTKQDFTQNFSRPESSPAKLNSDWNRTMHATKAILKAVGIIVEEEEASLISRYFLEPQRHKNNQFRPDKDFEEKNHIGDLVAQFLHDEKLCGNLSVFLGSGSTVYHVGRKMIHYGKKGTYKQRFVTVNIALAALWSECDPPPAKKISIPEAVLETETFRFATMQKPNWPPAIVIVGADGCHYKAKPGSVFLYAKDESIALNTNLFVDNASDLVVYCIASEKIKHDGRNTGPFINSPEKGVRKVLVTNKRPVEDIALAFERGGWTIVTEHDHWNQLPRWTSANERDKTTVRKRARDSRENNPAPKSDTQG